MPVPNVMRPKVRDPGFLFQLSHVTNRYRCVSGDPGENDIYSGQQKVSQIYLFMERIRWEQDSDFRSFQNLERNARH